MFEPLFEAFLRARSEYYAEMQQRIGGSKLHVAVPIVEPDGSYSLGALIHWLWSLHLARPPTIIKVTVETVKFLDYSQETKDLENWRGPVFDQLFEENEDKLLQISAPVFDCYLLNHKNNIVAEYRERFLAITPVEFIKHYKSLSPTFMRWLL